MFSHNLPETTLPSHLHIPANSDPTPPLQTSHLVNAPAQPSDSKKVGKWTPSEDELLRKFVALFSEKQWKKVSEQIPGRTPIQCLHRWTKILKPGLVKGPWTPEEDRQLLAWVKKEGPGKWAQASSLISGRSGKQCRERWFNNLNPEVKKGNWSTLEDELIFSLYQKYGSSWSKIARYIPGRTENSIKNRFYSTLRKLAAAKNRTGQDSVSPGHKDTETIGKDSKALASEGNKIGSPENEPNMLYGLLQEIACSEKQQKKEGEELNVKQEDGTEELKMKEKVKADEEKDKKVVKEQDMCKNKDHKEAKKVDQVFNLNGDKVVLARNTNASQHAIEEVAEKAMHTEIEENDTNFEHFVANAELATPSDLTRESSKPRTDPGFLSELEILQRGILDFCNYNVHDLMTAFKIASSEPNPATKHDIDPKGPVKVSPKNLLIAPDQGTASKTTPVQGLEGLSKLGFKRRQSQQFDLPHQAIGDFKPLTPVSVKIPPLDTKENENTMNIGKANPLVGRDLSENIHVFPKKGFLDSNPIKLPGVLEQKNFNLEGIHKPETIKVKVNEKNEGKQENELSSLVDSINNTIGAATLMYSHYLSQINDTVKNMDLKNIGQVQEKVGPLFQQLYGLESWLKNAKVDLVRLEGFVQDQKNSDSKVKPVGEENKRKMLEEDLTGSKWEQILKKRKIE